MALFRDCLEDCGLVDLGYVGPKFTWTNRQDADTHVKVRLDRAVGNGEFSLLFDDYEVTNVIATTSDHYAVFILLNSVDRSRDNAPVQQGFRFEAMWLRAPDYRDVFENAWREHSDGGRSLQSTWSNIQRVAGSLKDWSRVTFGSVRRQIAKLEQRLHALRRQAVFAEVIASERAIEAKLCELFEREE